MSIVDSLTNITPDQRHLTVRAGIRTHALRGLSTAIRTFRKTGISEQPAEAPTLQALLDDCFYTKRNFTLRWSGMTGSWSLYSEAYTATKSIAWKVEQSHSSQGEPKMLSAEIGIFRILLSQSGRGGNWRLLIVGGGEPLGLHATTADAAKIEALQLIRVHLAEAIQVISTK